jgi:FixJ family two-component response regulator
LSEALPPVRSRKLIAIVDDDEDVASALGSLVESMGIDAALFASADQFILDRQDDFDLVISDVQMPGRSGLDLAKHLRAEGLPIILITAFPSVEIERQAHLHGVWCFIRKPFDPDELIHCIERVLVG